MITINLVNFYQQISSESKMIVYIPMKQKVIDSSLIFNFVLGMFNCELRFTIRKTL